MSTLKQQHVAITGITEASIAAYLQAHPDFFERHAALLATLRLPHEAGGPAVSLVERQVSVLRQKNITLERKLKDLVDVARSNDELARKIHRLAIRLLEAQGRSDVVQLLEEQLRVAFSADRAVLVLLDADMPGEIPGGFLRVVPRDDPAIAAFRTFLQASTPRCGQVRDAQRDFLFGHGDVAIGSVALIPLGARSEHGFLAIGSRDAEHFHPGKSIDFLARIGELVTGALQSRA